MTFLDFGLIRFYQGIDFYLILSIILDKNSYILSNIIDKMVPLFAGIVFDVRVKGYKKPPTGFERAVGGVYFKKKVLANITIDRLLLSTIIHGYDGNARI